MRMSTLLRVAEDSVVSSFQASKPVARRAVHQSASWLSTKLDAIAASTAAPKRKAKRA